MPRINAPTVAEHRASRLRTLLDTARDLVAEDGPDALTLGALAKRVGLSRSSVYEYFRSRDDLAAAIIEDALPRWTAEIDAELRRHHTTRAKVAAYIRTQLEMLTDGRHTAATALSSHALDEQVRDRIRQEHDRLLAPLTETLRDGGVPDAEIRAYLINGMVNAAAARIGTDHATVDTLAEIATSQALAGLDLP